MKRQEGLWGRPSHLGKRTPWTIQQPQIAMMKTGLDLAVPLSLRSLHFLIPLDNKRTLSQEGKKKCPLVLLS